MYEKTYPHTFKNVLADGRNRVPGEYQYYCLSKAFVELARQLLQQLSERPFYFYGNIGNDTFTTVTREDFDIIQATMAEGIGELMSGCDIQQQLDCICQAIKDQTGVIASQSLGSQYAGGTRVPPNPFEDTGTNVPPDFPDRPTFETHKCDVATTIFNNLRDDVQYLQSSGALALGLIAFATGLLTPIPGDELGLLFGVLIVYVSIGEAFYTEYLNVLDSNKDDLICALYDAVSVEDAANSWLAIQQVAPEWSASLFVGVWQTAAYYFLNWNNLNQLFETATMPLDTGDCSGCSGIDCNTSYVRFGTKDSEVPGVSVTGTTVFNGTNQSHQWRVYFNATSENNFCGQKVRLLDITGFDGAATSGNNAYRIYDDAGALLYSGDTKPPYPINNVRQVYLSANQPASQYTVTCTYE